MKMLLNYLNLLGMTDLPGLENIEHVQLSPECFCECNSCRCSVSGLRGTVRSIEDPLDVKSAGLQDIDLRPDGESGATRVT